MPIGRQCLHLPHSSRDRLAAGNGFLNKFKSRACEYNVFSERASQAYGHCKLLYLGSLLCLRRQSQVVSRGCLAAAGRPVWHKLSVNNGLSDSRNRSLNKKMPVAKADLIDVSVGSLVTDISKIDLQQDPNSYVLPIANKPSTSRVSSDQAVSKVSSYIVLFLSTITHTLTNSLLSTPKGQSRSQSPKTQSQPMSISIPEANRHIPRRAITQSQCSKTGTINNQQHQKTSINSINSNNNNFRSFTFKPHAISSRNAKNNAFFLSLGNH
jgi:hypothetical protein